MKHSYGASKDSRTQGQLQKFQVNLKLLYTIGRSSRMEFLTELVSKDLIYFWGDRR